MNVFLNNFYESASYYIYFRSGIDIWTANRIERDFFKHINFQQGEHIAIQARECYVLNGEYTEEFWNSHEGYLVDWFRSYQFEDLEILNQALENIKSQMISKNLFDCFQSKLYQQHTNACRFVARVVYRKAEEEKSKSPTLNHNELILRSIDLLKQSLLLDVSVRSENKKARLIHFTNCPHFQKEISKNAIKYITYQICTVIAALFFLKHAGNWLTHISEEPLSKSPTGNNLHGSKQGNTF